MLATIRQQLRRPLGAIVIMDDGCDVPAHIIPARLVEVDADRKIDFVSLKRQTMTENI